MSLKKVTVAAGPISRMELPIFIVAVGVIMSGAMALLAATGNEGFSIIGVVLLGPSVTAVLLTALIIGRTGLRQLLIKQLTLRFGVRWYLIAFLLIPVVASIAVGLRTLFGGPDIAPDADYSPSSVLSAIVPILIITLVISLGEEFGWRGYALPRLQARLNAFPLIPEMTATGGLATFWVFLGVLWATTILVVLVFGPTHLSRSKPAAIIARGVDTQVGQGSPDKLAGTIAI